MYKCRACENEYTPTAHQIKKHDLICRPCARIRDKAYRLRRKEEGSPVISTKMNSLQLDLDYLLERITVLEAEGYDTVVAWLKEDAEHIKQLMEKDDA